MLTFGTDGVRGEFGKELTENYAANLAEVAAQVLQCNLVVIGRDTRESGVLLETAITKALATMGVEVQLMGVAPTPAIAFAARRHGVVAIAITASHNLYQDNGIKIFGAGGCKLSDAEQESIERAMLARGENAKAADDMASSSANSGVARPELLQEYCDWLVGLVRPDALKNLHVALDCANGAFSLVAPEVFSKLGATVTTINATPDGRNINLQCGATHPEPLSEVVKSVGAHFGVAFDGDGDRLIAVDGDAQIVDGDHLLAISALDMKHRGTLRNNKVVVTVMTNIGFHQAMKNAGIEVVTTPVGDRSVLLALDDESLSLGGEQSGHIIYRDLATTGDGLLAAVSLAALIADSKKSLREIANTAMTSFPQVLINLRVGKRVDGVDQLFKGEIAAAEKTLGASGRVLVRASGTEPMVRVMVEAPQQDVAEKVAATLAEAITARLG
ncbi:MAG: phosphoglucosamine mutase [Actinomycetota bacterium]|jgi:phosphoglucosamine mutase|nr:phosphoglucosamine mutase [Actinomycetota bacterium]MDA3003903.1 phosphoglucosamine mutase [Actinomycetota bacterium]